MRARELKNLKKSKERGNGGKLLPVNEKILPG